ncbi:hypothetical protein [Pseudomonas mangiferae]|uniref:hypothetical protein n=1 Tax=Pseudomonas mangiferae TaxID=2593654 RepID=UPI0015B5A8FD|nr:hypothetical protein [Pseudomonas mangiferae]
MSANPFLRGFDKLSIQLIVHELQPDSSLRELPYVIHAKDQNQSLVLDVQPTSEQTQHIVQRLRFETGQFSRCWGNQHRPSTCRGGESVVFHAYRTSPATLR